jgi:predicted phage terminase large subunit-like protein
LFGWLHVVLPAEFEPQRKFVMPDCLKKYVRWPGAVTEDPRTFEGESIHKARFTPDYIAAEKHRWKNTGNYAGQMQQRPAALEGQLIQRRWWGFFRLAEGIRDDIPRGDFPRPAMSHEGPALTVHRKTMTENQFDFDWITISIDPAAKKTEKGSQYGLLCIAGKGGRRFVLDDRTQRGAFHEIIDVVKDMIRLWKPDTLLIEPKAAGPDLMDTLREQMLKGDIPMVAIEEADPGNSDKEMRLQACVPYIKNGAVYLLDGASWLGEFVEELSTFPNGDNDDRVDALSQCLNHIREVDSELPDW